MLLFLAVGFVTEPLLGLSAATYPVVAAYGDVLFGMLLGGVVLLIVTSLIFTGSFALIKPDKPFQRYTPTQAGIVAIGFALVGVLQIYVNQAVLLTVLATPSNLATTQIIVDPTTALLLKIGSAVSEETLFNAATIAGFVTLVYFGAPRLYAAATILPGIAYGFVLFHQYTLQAIQDRLGALAAQQAWYFFFGARLILSGIMLGTLWYSTKKLGKRSASLAAPLIIHFTWNLVT